MSAPSIPVATLIGFSAVLMWALLATLTDFSGDVPPFQLSALTFAVGTLVGLAFTRRAPGQARAAIPLGAWVLGVAGLFGYHFFYFFALRSAPAIGASLINYLWPLLIVLGSTLMPGETLRWYHLAGALLGLAGTGLIITGGGGLVLDMRYLPGYGMALLSAVTWASYSLLSRRFASVPTSAVTGYCAATAILSLACHLLFEQTVWPQGWVEWCAVLGLGLMPVGAAFYTWDIGVKRGNIQVLGAASYAAPLLSTLLLIATGAARADASAILACVLITAGAVLAAHRMLLRPRSPTAPTAGPKISRS